jgi:hypothetical protein
MAKAAADMAAKAEAAKLALELEMAAKVAVMNLAKGGAERDAMVRIADLIQSILSATDAVNTPEAVAA